MPCKIHRRSVWYLYDKISGNHQRFPPLFRIRICAVYRLHLVIQYRCERHESMPFHLRGYIITNSIITRSQRDRTIVAERDILCRIRYLYFERKTRTLRHHQILSQKRCKYTVLRISGRSLRSSCARLPSRPHRSRGTLRSLRPGNPLRPCLPSFTGTPRRARLSSWPHRSRRARFSS